LLSVELKHLGGVHFCCCGDILSTGCHRNRKFSYAEMLILKESKRVRKLRPTRASTQTKMKYQPRILCSQAKIHTGHISTRRR
jgi:hypothetical protein